MSILNKILILGIIFISELKCWLLSWTVNLIFLWHRVVFCVQITDGELIKNSRNEQVRCIMLEPYLGKVIIDSSVTDISHATNALFLNPSRFPAIAMLLLFDCICWLYWKSTLIFSCIHFSWAKQKPFHVYCWWNRQFDRRCQNSF